MAESRRTRVPFEAIKALREKIDAGDPPLGPAVVLTDPRITDALGVSVGDPPWWPLSTSLLKRLASPEPGGCTEASVY